MLLDLEHLTVLGGEVPEILTSINRSIFFLPAEKKVHCPSERRIGLRPTVPQPGLSCPDQVSAGPEGLGPACGQAGGEALRGILWGCR